MSNSKDGPERWNAFEIIDKIMDETGRTKKLFMLMIITVILFPSGILLAMSAVFFQVSDGGYGSIDGIQMDGMELKNENMTGQEGAGGSILHPQTPVIDPMTDGDVGNVSPVYYNIYATMNFIVGNSGIISLIYVAWIIVGIRQWIVLSRWDKRYKEFKKSREQADKMFKDDET